MANHWWEIKIKTNPELEELVFWRLQELGCQGTATEKIEDFLVIRGYLPSISLDVLDLAALSLRLRQDFILAGPSLPLVSWELIDEEDWASSWKENWQPLEIGDRLLIYPAWLDVPKESNRIILRLDPGSAFGTGVHPTTQLCLESLEMRLSKKQKDLVIADIGCGSGILSIAAHLFGAKQIYAIDTDPLAIKATQENSYLNDIHDLHIGQGSIEKLKSMTDSKFDGILCNILAEVIKGMIPEMSEIIKPSGWGILSGILVVQSTEIANLLEKNGWTIAAMWKRQDWCCINIRRD
jgi:ribosomal protein L11 methyltransferase